jgi:hypothetical protein
VIRNNADDEYYDDIERGMWQEDDLVPTWEDYLVGTMIAMAVMVPILVLIYGVFQLADWVWPG